MDDLISRQAAIDEFDGVKVDEKICNEYDIGFNDGIDFAVSKLSVLPSAQPETAKRIVGKSKDGMTLWYQCDMCNEPVDAKDNFCRGCGRRLTDE